MSQHHIPYHVATEIGFGVFVFQIDPRQKFLSANPTFKKMLGIGNQAELESFTLKKLFINEDLVEEFLGELDEEGKIEFFDFPHPNYPAVNKWLTVSAKIDTNDQQTTITGVVQDITNYKEAQHKLNEEITILQGFLDSMPDAVYFKDRKNRLTKVNKFYADGFGMSE
ncbi:MAG: PAS domain S-box protein, partial [Candidatus Omnitrophica bacterium]|nr:PAS domain S-box protein [Candidatus Omnitrophota bacterium]